MTTTSIQRTQRLCYGVVAGMKQDAAIDWGELKRGATRSAFAARFEHPFLVLDVALEGDGSFPSFNTEVNPDVDGEPPERGSAVMPIVKKAGNPFHDRVSVGRANNCDIVIPDSSISKLHAHFTEVAAMEASLIDRESANGTTLNGTRLQADCVRVVSGDVIVFGVVTVQFVDAGRLWDLL